MMKKKFIVSFFFIFIISINYALSLENEVYKKIDLFGEVLEKINEEY